MQKAILTSDEEFLCARALDLPHTRLRGSGEYEVIEL
jgi:hypothetical protein